MRYSRVTALFVGVTIQTIASGQSLDFMTINAMGRCIAAAQVAKAEGVISGNARMVQT